MENIRGFGWPQRSDLPVRSYRSGFCGDNVASDKGYRLTQNKDGSGNPNGGIYICPQCNYPSFLTPNGIQIPGSAIGNDVKHVPDGVQDLYREARRCATEQCHTAAVLICRKILMNLATLFICTYQDL